MIDSTEKKKMLVTKKRVSKKRPSKKVVQVCEIEGFEGTADTLDVQSRWTVEERAYFKWLDAGCPHDEASRLRFWTEAEREYNEGY